MTCQRCPEEATVHLTESVEGEVREIHLCGPCAKAAGLPMPKLPPELALDAVLNGLILANVGELVGDLAQRSCPLCGLRFMEFRTAGRLGCPHDYQAFDRGLTPLIRQAHGASRHVGKTPRRRRPGDPTQTLRLRAELREAVAHEDYEQAARLRDQIRQKDSDA